MSSDPVAEQILKELEEVRWKYLGLLADRAEDEGDEELLLGYQWLIKYKRWPRERGGGSELERTYEWYICKYDTNILGHGGDSEDLFCEDDWTRTGGYTETKSDLIEMFPWAARLIGKQLIAQRKKEETDEGEEQ